MFPRISGGQPQRIAVEMRGLIPRYKIEEKKRDALASRLATTQHSS
jgi:hypothetical protein